MSEAFNLLDSSVDDLADLEKFTPIPAGTHMLRYNWSFPEHDEQVIVQLKLTVVETLEMANSSEPHPEPGKTGNIRFPICMKDGSPIIALSGKENTFGQGQLKEIISVLKGTYGGETTREVIMNSEGAEIATTLKVRASKNDPDQKFNEIKCLLVAE
jgi:hypothetical protein